MFKRIESRFGTAGLIVSVVALVAALGGSAYALTGSEKRQINKQIKKEAKKWGKRFARTGPAGPAGAQGLPGAAGANGQDGQNGQNGVKGDKGDQGEPGEKGDQGDPGEKGDQGDPGPEGTFNPSGFTQTGVYIVPDINSVEPGRGYGTMDNGEESIPLPVDFSIPVDPAPTLVFVPGDTSGAYGSNAGAGCPGVVGGVAQADPGKFCVYSWAGLFSGVFKIISASVVAKKPDANRFDHAESDGVSPTGAFLQAKCTTGTPPPEGDELPACFAKGVWAVTGS